MKIISGKESMVKILYFSDMWKVVSVAHQRVGVHLEVNLEVFFPDILAIASRSNTLHGLKTWYV